MSVRNDLIRNIYTCIYLLALRRSFSGALKKQKANQNRKIYSLMKKAYQIPFYREKFEQSNTTPEDYHSSEDLVKFPTLTKAELRDWMQEEWDNHPEKHNKLFKVSTSGSSGEPLTILYTLKEQACSDANWVRALSIAGYKPLRGKMYSFAASYRESNPNKRDSIIQALGLMRRKVVAESLTLGDGMADLVKEINEYKPDIIVLRRNVMVRLVQYAERHGLNLHSPKFYAPVGEMVDAVSRNILKKAFGDGLIDAYGLSELGSLIYEFPGVGYRYVANDIALANVYNDANELADDGRIIVTALYKHTYPLINYETGDIGKSYVKEGIRFFTDITGRMNDLVKHESGYDSSAADLMLIVNHAHGISQFRVIQESFHNLLIQLVANPFEKSLNKEETEKYIAIEIGKRFGAEFKIEFEWLDELPPDKTGKMRCFVCNMV